MAANVELTSTFDQWRVRTNQLLIYTQSDGGEYAVRIANNTATSSNTTGALIVDGGVGIGLGVTVGENLHVHGNITANGNITAEGGTITLGNASDDNLVLNADINSDIRVNSDNTYTIGNTTNRFASVYVDGVVGSNTDGAIIIPSGASSKRPSSPLTGQLRFNDETNVIEVYDGSGWTISQTGSQLSDADQDTKITVATSASGDQDQIRFFTGNSSTESTERMNIQGANVAIGTDNGEGDAMLKVAGTINATGNSVFTGATHLVKANVDFTGTTLDVSANTTITGLSTLNGNVVIDSVTLNVAANTTITGLSTLNGNVTISSETFDISSNTTITGYANLTGTLLVTEAATFQNNVTVSGNLYVTGTQTFLDSTNLTIEDKTLVIGGTRQTGTFTAANPAPVAAVGHGLTTGNKIYILTSDEEGSIVPETVFTVTRVDDDNFTIDGVTTSGSGSINFTVSVDTGIDGAGIIIPGNTAHTFTWSDTEDKWVATDGLKVTGAVEVTGNLSVTGTSTFTNLATFNGGLTIQSGNLTIQSGNLSVTGTSTFTNLATFNGGLTIQDGDTFTFDNRGFTVANQFTIANSSGSTIFSGYVFN